MSYPLLIVVTLARSLVVAGLAVWAGRRLRWRGGFVPVLALVILLPVIVVGYAYGRVALDLIRHPWLGAGLHATLLWLKYTPLAVLVLQLAPRSISPAGVHCFRMWNCRAAGACHPELAEGSQPLGPAPDIRLGSLSRGCGIGMTVFRDAAFAVGSGAWRPGLVAFALVALLVFQDFDLAALLNVPSWTVALFDAHAGGLPVGDSLRLAAGPALVELGLIVAVCALWGRAPRTPPGCMDPGDRLSFRACEESQPAPPAPEIRPGSLDKLGMTFGPRARSSQSRRTWLDRVFIALAATAVLVLPLALVVAQAWRGLPGLASSFGLAREILAGLGFGVVAATLAWWFARGQQLWLVLPGLLGPLVLALLLVRLAGPLHGTVIPLTVALTLLLLPVAWLLRLSRGRSRAAAALFLAHRVPRPRPLLWQLDARPRCFAWCALFAWAGFDLTAAAILAPVEYTPATVRLFNLMHYGRTHVLSAMLLVTLAAAGAVVLGAMLAFRSTVRAHG